MEDGLSDDEQAAMMAVASALDADADAQEAGDHESVGEQYDDVLGEALPFWDSNPRLLSMAFHFWDCWVDARNHDWNYYPDAGQDDWPRLARLVANALRSSEEPAGVPDALLTRPPTLRQRLRARFRGDPPTP